MLASSSWRTSANLEAIATTGADAFTVLAWNPLAQPSSEVVRVPVVAADGQTYERKWIEEWLQSHDTSPVTNERLEHRVLVPNRSIRTQVREFLDACARAGKDPHALV